MSVEQKPCQSHGVRSRAVVSSDATDTFPETHHLSCNTFPIYLIDLDNMNQLHEEVQLHTESNFNTDHHTKIIVESSYENKFAAFNQYKVNQNSICWDSFSKSNLMQLVPAIHSSNSVPSMMAAISPTMVSIKQKHQLDVIESPTVPLNKNDDDEKQTDNLDCPICGRKFVYQLNFTKHLAASGCCQPPCKKSRQEPVTSDAFKSNTLPRTSRSKKITRSNSIKSKKRQTIPSSSNHKQNCQLDFDATAQFHGNSLIMATSSDFQTTPSFSLTTTSESQTQLGIIMYCDFCQIQYSRENIFQRHRLAHALVIQLTRCLQLSLINNSQLYDSNISSYPAVQEWLVDQVRVNFNDQNWLIQAVREVELILNSSNIDVDFRERHGLADDNEFQKILDLLMTQELNLVSKPLCQSEAHQVINFEPEAVVFTPSVELSETSTSFTYDSSPAEPDSHSDALDTLANLTDESKVLPDMATEAVPDEEAESTVNNLDQFNDSLFVDLNAVEKQMADLFKPYQFSCSECGRCFSQQELVFEHMFLDHPIDKNHLPHEMTELSQAKKELNGSTISETLPFTDIGDFLTCAFNQNYQ